MKESPTAPTVRLGGSIKTRVELADIVATRDIIKRTSSVEYPRTLENLESNIRPDLYYFSDFKYFNLPSYLCP